MREEAEFEVEGYIGSRSRLRSRGGAPRRFATENVLCMLLGTPYSHLPQCCKQTTASQAAIHLGAPLFRTTSPPPSRPSAGAASAASRVLVGRKAVAGVQSTRLRGAAW